mmetsp:Transcript_27563/g.67785  ORF Transcript_27563/g.67785 Transcript_27563/m.67785 type:complete len:196 (+) Transcript_27563:254-841(+)
MQAIASVNVMVSTPAAASAARAGATRSSSAIAFRPVNKSNAGLRRGLVVRAVLNNDSSSGSSSSGSSGSGSGSVQSQIERLQADMDRSTSASQAALTASNAAAAAAAEAAPLGNDALEFSEVMANAADAVDKFRFKYDFLSAGLGALLATSYGISKGQSPTKALGITVCASIVAIAIDELIKDNEARNNNDDNNQ